MTINDNVSFAKISNTDINGRCIPPGWPQNRSESFGIEPYSIPAKFGGPSTPRTPTRDLVPFPYLMLIPEYPRMWNQMIRFLRHFDTVISVC